MSAQTPQMAEIQDCRDPDRRGLPMPGKPPSATPTSNRLERLYKAAFGSVRRGVRLPAWCAILSANGHNSPPPAHNTIDFAQGVIGAPAYEGAASRQE